MILMIDNYDSFTYNLVQCVAQLGEEVMVRRNDAISLEEIRNLRPTAIFISPGPCSPKEAGITVEVIRHFYQIIPILGVCLGHQAIGYAFGGEWSGPNGSCMERPPLFFMMANHLQWLAKPFRGNSLPLAHRRQKSGCRNVSK